MPLPHSEVCWRYSVGDSILCILKYPGEALSCVCVCVWGGGGGLGLHC